MEKVMLWILRNIANLIAVFLFWPYFVGSYIEENTDWYTQNPLSVDFKALGNYITAFWLVYVVVSLIKIL